MLGSGSIRRRLSRVAAEGARFVRARVLLGGRLTLVHDDRYALPDGALFDRARAHKILAHLGAQGWLGRRSVERPAPLDMEDLFRVHDAAYLESLDDPRVLASIFGEQVRATDAPRCLVAEQWATAGTIRAMDLAIRAIARTKRGGDMPKEGRVFANLGGGFHHAHPDRGKGFCAINDVAIAIGRARERGFAGRILVVDLDLHHGDGTRACFRSDERVFTYSMHAAHWDVSPAIASLDVELGPAIGDDTYLARLRSTLPAFFARAAPELVVFVAGVDVADGDALGSYRLTDAGIAARDRFVFELAARLPVVMVLAGGYGPDAWRYTARTLHWVVSARDEPIPGRDQIALDGFRAVRKRLGATRLTATGKATEADDITITEADLYGDLVEKKADPRLLGFYTQFGLEVAIERYGLAKHLRDRGYRDFVVSLDAIGTSGRGFRVHADRTKRDVLIEVAVAEHHDVPPFRLLSIEWLLLQDPRRDPAAGEVLLPGQRYPGLGALRLVVGMLVMTCERLEFDGLTLIPAHFHVATRARRLLRFLDPAAEALYLALGRATAGLDPADAAHRIARGDVVDARTGEPRRYAPARMVLPVSAKLREATDSEDYARRVEESARDLDLRLAGRDPSSEPC